MKNFFNVNFSVLGLMALLMCAPSLTGCSDDDDESERVMSLTSWCSTDTYDAQRVALTSLTLDGETITEEERVNYMEGVVDNSYNRFAEYFPNVTTVNFTGTTISVQWVLVYNNTVTTVIGKDIVSLDKKSFEHLHAATSYDLPKLENVTEWCFNANTSLVELSLPKLNKIGSKSFCYMSALNQVCFASMTDFAGAYDIFSYSNNITDLALGTIEQMTFDEGVQVKKVLGGPMASGTADNTTLYLNENGYEYQNNVDLTANTWQGITFKAIKKYSEYPGKKN